MIHKFAEAFTKWLLSVGAISSEDRELYEYAAYSLLFSSIPLFLALLIGSLFGMVLEGVLFILPFLCIRKFSGGFHLKSSAVCFVSSTLILSAFLFLIQFVLEFQNLIPFFCATISAAILLISLSPIDSEERQLSPKERQVFRKVAILLTLIVLAVSTILLFCGLSHYGVPIGSGLILAAALQVPCLVQKCFRAGRKPTV